MHESLKNKTFWKKLFFNFLGDDFPALKSGHRREKQPVLGPVCIFNIAAFGKTFVGKP